MKFQIFIINHLTALHKAVLLGSKEIVKLLLHTKGIGINITDIIAFIYF